MSDDNIFRIVMAAGMLAVMPIAVYRRLRSQATGEPLDRRQEGLFILLTLRPLGIAMMLAIIAFVIIQDWMAWSAMQLPTWLRWIGVALGTAAGALLIWTLRHLGLNLTDTVVTRRQHTLVTSGPYRFVRHPFYTATALAIVANALVTANWFIFAAGVAVFALLVI